MTNNNANNRVLIAPSILSADFSTMGQAVTAVSDAKADLIHVDVMDGAFVPNITFGPKMVKDIRSYTALPLDVHLMIEHPEKYVERFAESGSDILTVHYEACGDNLSSVLCQIAKLGIKRGVAINPDVPFEKILNVADQCELILLMSVFPGFGGQKFISSVLDKISQCKEYLLKNNLKAKIEVDGGINQSNCHAVAAAGADILVAGSAVFGSNDYAIAIESLKHPHVTD